MHCSGHYKPKLVYKGDRFTKGFRQSGNDRDEYVANNNGGFTVAHAPSTQLKPSTFYVPQRNRPFNSMGIDKTVRNNVKAHMVIYRQNGSGRDTYILGNNGGFCIQEGSKEFCGYQKSFEKSLRKYPPSQPRMQKAMTSVSPKRYNSLANNFNTTLNRFKTYMKQRGESLDATNAEPSSQDIKQSMRDNINNFGSEASRTQKMGHYRTQSQTITQETTERIKQYLQQRQAYSKAQNLQKSLSQNSTGSQNRNGSNSCGRLMATQERSSSNPRSRNLGVAMGEVSARMGKTQDESNEANLVLAVKSTPSLNQAFNKRVNKSRMTSNLYNNTQQPTGISENDSHFDKRANLNVASHEDLTDPANSTSAFSMPQRSRPMTTKFSDRRNTIQPQTTTAQINSHSIIDFPSEEVHGIYERHQSPQKTPMQVFDQHQQLTCARLSVPHERRRRERFNGTQNSLFQTVSALEQPQQNAAATNVSFFDGNGRNSVSSVGNVTPRVKTSLMGTTARQKLIKFRLQAQSSNNEVTNEMKKQIERQVKDLNKVERDAVVVGDKNEFDHMKEVAIKDPLHAKREKKERLLQMVYKVRTPSTHSRQGTQGARQTLKANLRQNLKQQTIDQVGRNTETNAFNKRHQSLQVTNHQRESGHKDLNRSSLI